MSASYTSMKFISFLSNLNSSAKKTPKQEKLVQDSRSRFCISRQKDVQG